MKKVNLINVFAIAFRFLLLAIVLFAVTSCDPCRRVAKYCPPEVEIRDSIVHKTETVYRDTTVTVKIPGDTVVDSVEVEIPCPADIDVDADIPPSPGVYPNKLTVEGHLASAHSWIKQNRLFLELNEKDTLIEVRLKNVIREKEHWKERYQSKRETLRPPDTPWWKTALQWIGGITILCFLLIIGIKATQIYFRR